MKNAESTMVVLLLLSEYKILKDSSENRNFTRDFKKLRFSHVFHNRFQFKPTLAFYHFKSQLSWSFFSKLQKLLQLQKILQKVKQLSKNSRSQNQVKKTDPDCSTSSSKLRSKPLKIGVEIITTSAY